jgi:hypothetical protein
MPSRGNKSQRRRAECCGLSVNERDEERGEEHMSLARARPVL